METSCAFHIYYAYLEWALHKISMLSALLHEKEEAIVYSLREAVCLQHNSLPSQGGLCTRLRKVALNWNTHNIQMEHAEGTHSRASPLQESHSAGLGRGPGNCSMTNKHIRWVLWVGVQRPQVEQYLFRSLSSLGVTIANSDTSSFSISSLTTPHLALYLNVGCYCH